MTLETRCASAPSTSGVSRTTSKLGSGPVPPGRPANRSERPSWPSESTLIPIRLPSFSNACIFARPSTEISTSGGRSETDMNALAVIPCTWSADVVVMTVTPVANIPSVRRNARTGSSPSSPSICISSGGGVSSQAPEVSASAAHDGNAPIGRSNSTGTSSRRLMPLAPGEG